MFRTAEGIPVVILLIACVSGCGQQSAQATANGTSAAALAKAKYVLQEEPGGAVGVMIAREDAKDQDEIVLVGRIGGRKNPWIDGRAAFTMIDAAMTIVASGKESSAGQICMDDCCAALRTECTTLVKLVDEQGAVLPIDARELLQAQENDMVVVKGKVRRDGEGSFSVAASGVYVRK
ncbi:MAG: hypothetical protein WBF93_10645 [Pirellulales bacterium]